MSRSVKRGVPSLGASMNSAVPIRLLVTGACGVTSRSVVRALKSSHRFQNATFIGSDICENLYGLAEGLYERIYRVPHVSNADYAPYLNWMAEHEGVDLAIVIPEPEVLFWSRHRLAVPCLIPPPRFCELAGSKRTLYESLSNSGTVPIYETVSREVLLNGGYTPVSGWPCWIRAHDVGTSSGRGSLMAHNDSELTAWATLNADIGSFMVSEFLPGRNLACLLLYHGGSLIKTGTYERLEYFMSRTAPSGITGNISRGRLLTDDGVLATSRKAVEMLCNITGEIMEGMVAVDLRENSQGQSMITEINLRHVACTSAFASAGHNLAEAHVLATLGRPEEAGPLQGGYPKGNLILRDIDGAAIWVPELALPATGLSYSPRL